MVYGGVSYYLRDLGGELAGKVEIGEDVTEHPESGWGGVCCGGIDNADFERTTIGIRHAPFTGNGCSALYKLVSASKMPCIIVLCES